MLGKKDSPLKERLMEEMRQLYRSGDIVGLRAKLTLSRWVLNENERLKVECAAKKLEREITENMTENERMLIEKANELLVGIDNNDKVC